MSQSFNTPRNAAPRRSANFITPRATLSESRVRSSSTRRLSAAFKSPMRQSNETSNEATADEKTRLENEIKSLQDQETLLDKEIETLLALGYREEELKDHIEKLHDYNEMKDLGQMLLGKIAVSRGITTADLYNEYGMQLDD